MSAVAPDEAIVPFQDRLGEIARYPAHPAALATVATLTVCDLVAGMVPVLGWLLVLFVWAALYRYAFECLRTTADGVLEPPEIATDFKDELGWMQIALQLGFAALAVLAFRTLGVAAGCIVALVLALALPGATMSLAMDENIGVALHPGTWLAVIRRLGGAYFAVVAACAMQFLFEIGAGAFALPLLPWFLGDIATHAIAFYVVIAAFHLMGYLILQYHDELGYTPQSQTRLARPGIDDPDQPLLDDVQELVRDGEPQVATDLLGEHLRTRGGSEGVHAQYRKLLAQTGRRDESLRHGREWITILLAQDNDRRAVDVARECLELDPEFQCADPAQHGRLARKASGLGMNGIALRLVSAFHRRHPGHADIPANYLLAAKILAERLGRVAEARALIDQLSRVYPDHAQAADITAYRRFLDSPGQRVDARPGAA